MTDTSPRLALPYIQPAQAQKHVTHNEALRVLDVLVQLTVTGFDATTPPSLPVEGEVYAVGAGADGAWLGQDGMLAVYVDGYWQFHEPQPGWVAADAASAALRVWTGSAWIAPNVDAIDNLDHLGVNTTADATNRLAVSAPATLLTHEGADHRLKVNKASVGDTASLLFQTDWSGRAEMGLAGNDAFSVKVSADGTTWTEALVIDPETGQVALNATATPGLELEAVEISLAVSAVDGMIYDTARDSDGGAWRQRCETTSWFNEALNTASRGVRRDFPAVALIVAASDAVTIFDADDPAQPMWRVMDFAGQTITSVAACEGRIAVGLAAGGVCVLDLAGDRLASTATYTSATTPAIVNDAVTDVAMTVLADAPIDPATGLAVPTIAAATAGGVSVINDDGTIADSLETETAFFVDFMPDGALVYTEAAGANDINVCTSYAADGFTASGGRNYSAISVPALYQPPSAAFTFATCGAGVIAVDVGGVQLIKENPATPAAGLSARLTSTFSTGWMPGDIKGAWLADTDDTALVGATPLDDDFTAYADQAAAEAAGWSADLGWTFDAAGDQWDFDASAAGAGVASSVVRSVAVVAGETYMAEAVISGTTNLESNECFIVADGKTLSTSTGSPSVTSDGIVSCTFVASSSLIEVKARSGGVTEGDETFSLDRFTIRRADTDRSLNTRGLAIGGTIARAPVAPGAELMAYSGFSASDTLEQPYNAGLDFGTGDFCVMGWVKGTSAPFTMLAREVAGSAANRFGIEDTGAELRGFVSDGAGTTATLAFASQTTAEWRFIAFLRRGGVLESYDNGVLSASLANAYDISNPAAVLAIGNNADHTAPFGGALALLRLSASAPGADQIRYIFETEKALFQPDAACTLIGATDTVVALARDPVTGLLHIGTGAGRSDIRGLARVADAAAVTTFIAATGGRILEQ